MASPMSSEFCEGNVPPSPLVSYKPNVALGVNVTTVPVGDDAEKIVFRTEGLEGLYQPTVF